MPSIDKNLDTISSHLFILSFVCQVENVPLVTSSLYTFNYTLENSLKAYKMPKKKTGQRKKAEKQKLRQKEIRSGKEAKPLTDWACNSTMVSCHSLLNCSLTCLNCCSILIQECDKCERKQKMRAFCYFCQSLQRLPMCGHCGKLKCMLKTGDCVVKHGSVFTTGLGMVVSYRKKLSRKNTLMNFGTFLGSYL